MKYGDDASQIRISDITLVRDASSSPSFKNFDCFTELMMVNPTIRSMLQWQAIGDVTRGESGVL